MSIKFDELMNRIHEKREIIAKNEEKIKTKEEKIKEIYAQITPFRKNVTQALDALDSYDFEEITVRFGDLKNELIRLHQANGDNIIFDIHTSIRKYAPFYNEPQELTVQDLVSPNYGPELGSCSLIVNILKIEEGKNNSQLYSFYAKLPNFNSTQADGNSLISKASVANSGYYSELKFDNPDDILTNISYKTMKNVSSESNIDFFEAVRLSEYTKNQESEM